MSKFLKMSGLFLAVVVIAWSVSGCKSKTTDDPQPMEDIYVEDNGLTSEGDIGGTDSSNFEGGADESTLANLTKDDLVILTDLNFPVIYFPYDSNKLVESEMAKIEKVAEYLNKYSSLLLIVEGHCDQRGTEEYNRSLGERRANMIRESLVAAGVNSDRIRTVSYGKDRPAVEGNDESAWGKNRRGELLPAKKK
ncbi:MAG: OmpA family protein [Lentisphaeria bacterium]|nr:OmpA family protein [Lentisphaeria bacterium]MBR7127832.1 OmpA family protein [Lentisphaeria bacterium]